MKIGTGLARDTMIYGASDAVARLIGFFTFPIIAAALSPRAFGTLELIMTVVGLAGAVAACGLNNSVQRYYWDASTTEADRPRIVSTGIYLLVVFSMALMALGLLFSPLIMNLIRRSSLPVGIIAIGSALLSIPATQALQYIQDVTRLHFAPFKFLAVVSLNRIAAAILAMIAVVSLHAGLDGYLLARVGATTLAIPVGLILIRKDLRPQFDRGWSGRLVSFGYPFIFASVAYWLFGSMDRWFLATMSSVEESGIYSVSYRFASILTFAVSAFSQAWSPYAIKVKTDHPESYRLVYGRVFVILFFGLLVVGGGIMLFAGELIKLTMPEGYAKSVTPLVILCMGLILHGTTSVTAVGISLEKRTSIFATLTWITAGINAVGNYLLIPRLGAVGAAWSTAASYLVLTVGYLYFTQRLHPMKIKWSRLIVLVALGTVIGFVALIMNHYAFQWRTLLIKLAIAAACLGLAIPLLPIKESRNG